MAKIARKYLAHFIDAAFNVDKTNYVRLGKDLEEYTEELNPEALREGQHQQQGFALFDAVYHPRESKAAHQR